MKKLYSILALTLLTSCTPCIHINAISTPAECTANLSYDFETPQEYNTIELLENGDYLETTITETPIFSLSLYSAKSSKTTTKTKTIYYKNSNGTILWSVYIRATFSYDGSTYVCTSCSHGYSVNDNKWSIANISSSKYKNTATTNVTAKQTQNSGATQTINRSITIKCSTDGTVS